MKTSCDLCQSKAISPVEKLRISKFEIKSAGFYGNDLKATYKPT